MLFFATERHSLKAILTKSPASGGESGLSSIPGSASYSLGDGELLRMNLSFPTCEPGIGTVSL